MFRIICLNMAVVGLCCVLLLIFIDQIECASNMRKEPSDTIVDVLNLYPCKDTDPLTKLSMTLKTGDNGEHLLDGTMEIQEEVTEEFTAILKIDRGTDGVWQNVLKETGTFCEYVEKFAQLAWEKARNKIEPSIPDECEIEPGSYKIQDLRLVPQDFTAPVSIFGTFRAELRIMNPNKDLFLCQTLEVELRNF